MDNEIKDVQKIEIGGMTIFEKKDPIYNSLVLGVPIKYIAGALIVYKVIKGVIHA